MINVLVNGCNGRMGQVVCELLKENDSLNLLCGFDKNNLIQNEFPIYDDFSKIEQKPDVIIDFSIPIATMNILEYAVKNSIPIVIATTGFSEEQNNMIKEYSKDIPIFKSANMSFDIMVMKKIVSWLASYMKNTDIEIIESHHNRKIDSPSGTAQMLADSINLALGNTMHCEYDRHSKHEKRDKQEIGMSSIRGGNIVGEHTVQFIGDFETFEIKHTSYSRNVFAEGSLKAAEFIVKQKPGLYSMEEIFSI